MHAEGTGTDLFRMEQLAVSAGPDLVHDSRLQVDVNSAGNVLSGSGLSKERIERVIASSDRFVRRHLTVRLNPVFQTVQFPAGISHLDSGLSHMD